MYGYSYAGVSVCLRVWVLRRARVWVFIILYISVCLPLSWKYSCTPVQTSQPPEHILHKLSYHPKKLWHKRHVAIGRCYTGIIPEPSRHLSLDVDPRVMLQEQLDQGSMVVFDPKVQGCVATLHTPVRTKICCDTRTTSLVQRHVWCSVFKTVYKNGRTCSCAYAWDCATFMDACEEIWARQLIRLRNERVCKSLRENVSEYKSSRKFWCVSASCKDKEWKCRQKYIC